MESECLKTEIIVSPSTDRINRIREKSWDREFLRGSKKSIAESAISLFELTGYKGSLQLVYITLELV